MLLRHIQLHEILRNRCGSLRELYGFYRLRASPIRFAPASRLRHGLYIMAIPIRHGLSTIRGPPGGQHCYCMGFSEVSQAGQRLGAYGSKSLGEAIRRLGNLDRTSRAESMACVFLCTVVFSVNIFMF